MFCNLQDLGWAMQTAVSYLQGPGRAMQTAVLQFAEPLHNHHGFLSKEDVMPEIIYQQNYQSSPIDIEYRTTRGRYRTAHWHPELEIVYLLNGTADFVIEGQRFRLVQGDALVIDANQIHGVQARHSMMQLIIHVNREFINAHLEHAEHYLLHLSREELIDSQVGSYLEFLDRLKELVPLYVRQPAGYRLESESVVLDICYRLIRDFSIPLSSDDHPSLTEQKSRIQDILRYIDDHYQEKISLGQIAGEFGLSREYFSRLFRKSVGMTFTDHLNRVRLTHVYQELLTTDKPVMEIIEEQGFTNYKLFSRMFKEIYGSTPRDTRKKRD